MSEPVAPVTVVLVRHAETAEDTAAGGDPGLSEAGGQRAARLARLLGAAGVTHAWCSEFQRTRATLTPLAERAGVPVREISARAPQELEAAIRALQPGAVAVVCGHSNTVPALARALGVTPAGLVAHERYGPMLPHDAYDRVWVVTLPGVRGAAPSLLELRS